MGALYRGWVPKTGRAPKDFEQGTFRFIQTVLTHSITLPKGQSSG